MTRKYFQCLKHGKVIPIDEAEQDRSAIAATIPDFTKHFKIRLDGKVYKYLAQMQKLRGLRFTQITQDPQERLRMVAWELWKRTTPTLFMPTPQRPQSPINLSTRQVVGITPPSIQMDTPKILTNSIPPVHLTHTDLEKIRSKVMVKVLNKRFTLSDLHVQLSHWEADILSLLVKDNVLQVQIKDEYIEFDQGDGTPTKRVVLCIIPGGDE